jgi:DNA-binding transcriptional regulator YdaS (Cro superfamily)
LDRASATAQHKMAGFFAVSGANGSQGTIGGQAKSQSAFDAINSAISGIDVTALEKGDSGSRELAFEKLKLSMQRISEGMQALTNTLSMTHESAKTAINNLKA